VTRSHEAIANAGVNLAILLFYRPIFALFTFYFFYEEGLHWFYRIFGVWDGAFAVIFCLFLIHLASDDIAVLNTGVILPGLDRPSARKALLLFHSLTGNGTGAIRRVKEGLNRNGYTVTKN